MLGKKRGYYIEQAFIGSPSKLYRVCGDARVLPFYPSKPLKAFLRFFGYADARLEGTQNGFGPQRNILAVSNRKENNVDVAMSRRAIR